VFVFCTFEPPCGPRVPSPDSPPTSRFAIGWSEHVAGTASRVG